MFNGGIILLRNNKPGEQEEIIEPVAGTLSSHVTRVGLEILGRVVFVIYCKYIVFGVYDIWGKLVSEQLGVDLN